MQALLLALVEAVLLVAKVAAPQQEVMVAQRYLLHELLRGLTRVLVAAAVVVVAVVVVNLLAVPVVVLEEAVVVEGV